MPDGLVQQYTVPTWTDDHIHLTCWARHCGKTHLCLPDGLRNLRPPLVGSDEPAQREASAKDRGASFPPSAALQRYADRKLHERARVADVGRVEPDDFHPLILRT